jgi:hypothetical protein
MSLSEEQVRGLLDFQAPFDLAVLEGLVMMMYTSLNPNVWRAPVRMTH